MTRSILVEDRFRHLCLFCQNPAVEQHHLICGTANRRVSDDEGLVIPLCEYHHKVFAHNVDGKHEMEAKSIEMMAEWAWIASDLAGFISTLSNDITSPDLILKVEKDKFRGLFGKSLV